MERLWRQSGLCNMNIFKAFLPSTSSKELKTTIKIVCGDLVCNSVWLRCTSRIHLSTSICALETSFSKGLVFWDDASLDFSSVCWPTCQRAGHLFPQVACAGLCICSKHPHQITVGWILSRTTDDSLDSFTQTFCPGLCDFSHIYETNYVINSQLSKSTLLFNSSCLPAVLFVDLSSEVQCSVADSRGNDHADQIVCD